MVPPYQRDYSWKIEHWEDLWNDIEEQATDDNGRHYMGAVVVEAIDDRRSRIIHGQQRIATLTILGLAIINRLNDLAESSGDESNKQRAEALRSRFIGEKDPASLTEISKLQLNETDNGFFQDYIVQLRLPHKVSSLQKSNRQLWECFRFFEDKLKQKFPSGASGEDLAKLLSETVARKLLFILISVNDDMSAYTVFETLNARGLELTVSDLLKNYLFSRLKARSDLDSAQRRWLRLVATVQQERFSEFLRYHYLTMATQVRTARLFKKVRDEVKSPQDVLDLLTQLESRAELFDALFDSSHSFWNELPEVRPFLRRLNLFRVQQMTPLLFVAYERLDRAEFVRTLKCLTVVSFRYNIISELNTNALEPVYSKAAISVLEGRAKSAREIFDEIKQIYVPDDKFESDFSQQSFKPLGQKKKLVKYILCSLEEDASGRSTDFDTDPATIEHILPQNASGEWSDFFKDEDLENYVYRLGNLTLLEAKANRSVSNLEYAAKLPEYERSSYEITRNIVERHPEEWTPFRIEARQRFFAARAKHIWRSDFA